MSSNELKIASLLLFTLTIFASSAKAIDSPHNGWYLGAELGLTKPNLKNTTTVNNGSNYPAPSNQDRYSIHTSNMTDLGVQLGYRFSRNASFIPAYSIGLRYQHLFQNKVQGSVIQYSLADFNNYRYAVNVQSNLLSLYSKIDIATLGPIMPYVDLGLGMVRSRISQFSESPNANITPRLSPSFAARTQGQFAYTLGAGIDITLMPKLWMNIGYDFQSLGNLSTGHGNHAWSADRLNFGTFKTNTGLIGLTYLMN